MLIHFILKRKNVEEEDSRSAVKMTRAIYRLLTRVRIVMRGELSTAPWLWPVIMFHLEVVVKRKFGVVVL